MTKHRYISVTGNRGKEDLSVEEDSFSFIGVHGAPRAVPNKEIEWLGESLAYAKRPSRPQPIATSPL